ncbi:LysR family transcriptional regulator [Psychrobium sp. nBUS_13]|uniref:LysR family transcriptional regulator n=1 Tax=Psychrobium sp. nBUS_13 TaxID=3395319 RepID=UPI003EB8FF4B
MTINANLLSQLFTFEKTAHCTSFTQAVKVLNVTTGAVSQQIRGLESTVGFLLFKRHSRGISITNSGILLRDAVSSGIAGIESTLLELMRDGEQSSEIHLKLTPSFAYKWLVPRLESFYKQYPHITITTYAEGGLVNYQEHNYDLAIDYQQTPFNNPNAQLLLAEQLLPVMSPAYLQQLQWPEDASNTTEAHWQQANLLHDAMVWPNADNTAEWQAWLLTQLQA